MKRTFALACFPLLLCVVLDAYAEKEDLGNGFLHHGVATPVSKHRGTVATVDGEDRDVVLVWLFDHRGGYALLMLDALSGKSEQIETPFPPGGDCPYSSILSSKNKYYTHFNSYFCEFDPEKRAFTFHKRTRPQMAMGMTEDDNGVIWSVTYPNSGVVSYDPASGEFNDYGHVYDQNWRQYQRHVAADDAGWIYFGIGSTASQVIMFNPETEEAKPVAEGGERVKGAGYVVRAKDGKVYGHTGSDDNWYVFHKGEATPIEKPDSIDKKPIITSSQALFHREFPSGRRLVKCDLVNRVIVVENAETDETIRNTFDYTSEGAHVMGLAAAPDGTICGGTAFPMRFFSYDPKADEWTNRAAYGQWNTVAKQGDMFFVGGYGGGFLLEWDPAEPWVPTEKGKEGCNPQFLTQCTPVIHRPHDLLAHPDGKTLVLAGTPGYGYTGGGLLFWDRETEERTLLEHTDILPDLSTMSLAALPDGDILGGATIAAGTGGEVLAEQAELYILDLKTKELLWHEVMFPDVNGYTDLVMAKNGYVYGIADRVRFFVFDPKTREVIHEMSTAEEFGPSCSQQGPRVFVQNPEGDLYMLFQKGVAQVDLENHEITMLAESPVSIGPGGTYLDGRIYFGSGSHLYSYGKPGL
ncbi:MAG: hypothetical protein ACLFTT_09770 [Candidatus Hydrogenedentota bacterium]